MCFTGYITQQNGLNYYRQFVFLHAIFLFCATMAEFDGEFVRFSYFVR